MSWISALLQFRSVPLRCIFWSSSPVRFTEGPSSEYPHEVSFRLNQTWSGFDFEECSSKALNIWSTACKAVSKLPLKSIWCQCQTLAHIHLLSKCFCSAVLIVTDRCLYGHIRIQFVYTVMKPISANKKEFCLQPFWEIRLNECCFCDTVTLQMLQVSTSKHMTEWL